MAWLPLYLRFGEYKCYHQHISRSDAACAGEYSVWPYDGWLRSCRHRALGLLIDQWATYRIAGLLIVLK